MVAGLRQFADDLMATHRNQVDAWRQHVSELFDDLRRDIATRSRLLDVRSRAFQEMLACVEDSDRVGAIAAALRNVDKADVHARGDTYTSGGRTGTVTVDEACAELEHVLGTPVKKNGT